MRRFALAETVDGEADLRGLVAWNLFNAESREVLRAALKVDEATWQRGRGWALSVGLIALPYYEHSNPALAAVSRYAVREVLADSKFDT